MNVDDLIPAWRSELHTKHSWQLHPRQIGAGEAAGMLLICPEAPNGGYMKPGAVKGPEVCIAATEKICADLAVDLSLPVPPVLLYEKEPQIPAAESRCCISLVLHPKFHTWGEIWPFIGAETLVGAMLHASLPAMSGIVAFDTWVGNSSDRNNVGNVIYGHDPQDTTRNRFLAIDFSMTLNRDNVWANNGWETMHRVTLPAGLSSVLDKRLILDTADRISALSDRAVADVVTRIPDNYMNPAHKSVVVSGLNGRKALLKAFLLQNP